MCSLFMPTARRLAVVLGIGMSMCSGVAAASFPGRNGELAVSLEGCSENRYIRAYDLTGRNLGPLTPPCEPAPVDGEVSPDEGFGPEWSPDGQRLLFSTWSEDIKGLATIAPDGSGLAGRLTFQDITTPRSFLPRHKVSVSPDGRAVAFAWEGSIWVGMLDSGELRRLRRAPPCDPDRGLCVFFQAPRWSPRGAVIAFEAHADGPVGDEVLRMPAGIWLMDARTGKLIRRVARAGYEIDWSPDGRRLAYRTEYEQREIGGGATGGDIYVVRTDGAERRRIVRRRGVAETYPTWSPDGRSIAWVSFRFGGGDVGFRVNPSLWRVRARGGHPIRIRGLPSSHADEAEFHEPELAWRPLTDAQAGR